MLTKQELPEKYLIKLSELRNEHKNIIKERKDREQYNDRLFNLLLSTALILSGIALYLFTIL